MVSEVQMERSSLELYLIKQTLNKLEKRRSFNGATCLITLYIKPESRVHDITSTLREEQGTAVNIKDKNTSKAVVSAISSVLSNLKTVRPGKNGLAIFAGVTQLNKMEFYMVNPPEPITIKQYICDSYFHVEHLKEIVEEKKQYGFIVVDRGGATFAVAKGNHMDIIMNRQSFVPGKHGRGGQSQRRIERGIEILAQDWFRKIAEEANRQFLKKYPVEGIVVGGPAMSKDDFLKHKVLDYRLREKIIGIFDIGYTGVQGIKELQAAAKDTIGDLRILEEQKLVEEFLTHLGKDTGLATYGEKQVRVAIEGGAVDKLLLSDNLKLTRLEARCEGCGNLELITVKEEESDTIIGEITKSGCKKCNEKRQVIESEVSIVEDLGRLAQEISASVDVISAEHENGAILSQTFGGIAGILRYQFTSPN